MEPSSLRLSKPALREIEGGGLRAYGRETK